MIKIPLVNSNEYTIIDKEDEKEVSKYKWRVRYASRKTIPPVKYAETIMGKKRIQLHRFLLKPKEGQIIDHMNRDSLDNRKGNLRLCTYSENGVNSFLPRINKNGYLGVKKIRSGRFMAVFKHNKHLKSFGTYDTPEEAGLARDRYVFANFGKLSNLNFPEVFK